MSDYIPDMNSELLDLNHLTKEERAKIEDVLNRDRKLMIRERIRLG